MLLYLCRNAEVSNDFKVDLHALHVDEALSSLEDAIVDLQRFKCRLPNHLCVSTSLFAHLSACVGLLQRN